MRGVSQSTWVALLLAVAVLTTAQEATGQDFQIGIIDFYGLHRVSQTEARRALTFAVGDGISLAGDAPPGFLAESERRLAKLPGIERALTNLVCCDSGRLIVYVGVEEQGGATPHFRAAPTGSVRLPADVVQAGSEYSTAHMAAVQRGDAGEDDSLGHALMHDPTARAIQERFVVYAARDEEVLLRVLRKSSDADQRALAAQVLGYVADKQSVVDDLVYATSDPSDQVRNSAMRALAVFAKMTPGEGRVIPQVPTDPFIGLLNSLVWTDRNKSALALMELTENRNAVLLTTLRGEAMGPLVEMARWRNQGHAMPALLILGRIAGWSDDAVLAAWGADQREDVIQAALESH